MAFRQHFKQQEYLVATLDGSEALKIDMDLHKQERALWACRGSPQLGFHWLKSAKPLYRTSLGRARKSKGGFSVQIKNKAELGAYNN